MSAKSRRAFTVVELLVVIAIIGVLVALTVPAIQVARESARRTICLNNVKQFAIAMHSFSSGKEGELPSSREVYTINRSGGGTRVVLGWVYPILPHIEQQGNYDTIRDLGIPAGDLELELALCPSRPDVESARPMSYVVNGGRANANGNGKVNEDAPANGALIDMAMGKLTTGKTIRKWDDCVDGNTNTLLIAENLNLADWLIPYRDPASATDLANAFQQEQQSQFLWFPDPATAIPPNRHANPALRPQDVQDADFDAEIRYGRPASHHSGGYMVAFWDGHTKFLGDSIEYEVYGRLMSSQGIKTQDPADTNIPPTRPDPPWQALPLSKGDY